MKNLNNILLSAILLGLASAAQARVIAVRIPTILPTNPIIIKTNAPTIPTSQIPTINIPNIIPTIGELPQPVIPTPTFAAERAEQPVVRMRTYGHAARVHAVPVPLVQADAGSDRKSQRRDTVENRLSTARLVESIANALGLEDATTLEDLESAFDGRADEDTADEKSGIVVLPERELEEELGLH